MPKGKGPATKDKKKTGEKDDPAIATLAKKDILDDEEKELDPETILGEEIEVEDSEDEELLDNDEVNPFGDKWEE